jgi:hypothetical protein
VDRRHYGLGQRLHPVHHLLPLEAQPLRRALGGERRELVDVGARDEAVRLPGDEDRRADRLVVAQPDQERLEFHLDRIAQLVDRLARQVERDDRDPVLDRRREGRH